MSETVSISTGIAARYATAVYELAKESNTMEALESDLTALETALSDSADFSAMISSPVYARAEMSAAIAAVADKMGLSQSTNNVLRLMASKRRLFVLPQLLKALRARISEDKGEMTADVVSAKPMTKAQTEKLASTLKASMGKDILINATVDESLIGGLIIQVGSKMIDTSIASKLSSLQNAMKEVG